MITAVVIVAIVFVVVPLLPLNHAPTRPVVLSQIDGMTRGHSPTLRAEANDPDGGTLDVSYYGRSLTAAEAGGAFTFVVVPDPQNYTRSASLAETYFAQMRWIMAQRRALDIRFVASVGDLVQRADYPAHWSRADRAWRILEKAGVPHSVVPGNHDLGPRGESASYDRFFPPSTYEGEPWYGGYMGDPTDEVPDPEDRGNRDSYQTFSANGVDLLVLNLEIDLPPSSIAWAGDVIDAHPDHQVIVVTHRWLRQDGVRWRIPLYDERVSSAPEDVWEQLIEPRCNVVLVLTGHDAGEAHRVDENSCGRPVFQLLADYQRRPRGGDGWLRTITFDSAASMMRVDTYSVTRNAFEIDANSRFTLPWAGAGAPFVALGRDLDVTSGKMSSWRWLDLEPGGAYEWFAIADDGALATVGMTRRFSTPVEEAVTW